jgi:hypothetical protein
MNLALAGSLVLATAMQVSATGHVVRSDGMRASDMTGGPVLRAGTVVPMRTLETLNSKTVRQGQRFALNVSADVVVDGLVVIPRGARGTGEIARVVSRGMFGKPGKLEVRMLFVEAGGARIRLDGRAAERGKAKTGVVVAGAVLIGVSAGFVKGKSAEIPAGTEVAGYVYADLPLTHRD